MNLLRAHDTAPACSLTEPYPLILGLEDLADSGANLAGQKSTTTATLMTMTRILQSAEFMQPSDGDGEPIRSVIAQSPEAVVIAWHVNPGQRVAAHIHPHGQDTWTVLSGSGEYQVEQGGRTQVISQGCVVIAPTGCVHGVFNGNKEPLVFISVVSPADAGYELAQAKSRPAGH